MAVKLQMKLWVLAISAMLAYGAVSLAILSQHPANKENAAAAGALPDIYFFDAAGKKLTLADFAGKPVLVNLWATWCPPCVAELPSLDRLQAKLGDKRLAVVAISMDRGSDIKPVAAFLRKQRIEHIKPYWDKDHEIMTNWKYDGLPVSLLLDGKGAMVAKYEGPYTWDKGDMLKKVEKLAP